MSGRQSRLVSELAELYRKHGKSLHPRVVLEWARAHPKSELYRRLDWDDASASEKYRLHQVRLLLSGLEEIITITLKSGKTKEIAVPIYRSLPSTRKSHGFRAMVDILDDEQQRAELLACAVAEYERVGARFASLKELVEVKRAVAQIARKLPRRKSPSSRKVA